VTNRLIRAGDAVSQLCNVIFLNGEANESISGRSYRQKWRKTELIINAFLSPFEKNHCKISFDNDLKRAEKLIKKYGSSK